MRTREETAELTISRDFLLNCFLSCAPGLNYNLKGFKFLKGKGWRFLKSNVLTT